MTTHLPPKIKRRALANDEVVAAARTGGRAAIEELLTSVQPRIYAFALKLCGNAADAEDVVQETLLAVATKLGEQRPTSSFSSWTFTIARNACLKVLRRRDRGRATARDTHELGSALGLGESASSSNAATPQERAEQGETWERLGSALRTLTDEQREVLLLRDVEGLTAREVADVLGVGVQAVKSRLHRARTLLRTSLSGEARPARAGCPDIRQAFSEQLEGDLPVRVCAEMESHIAECRRCAAECDGLREVLAVCATTDLSCTLPAAAQTRFERAIRRVLREQ